MSEELNNSNTSENIFSVPPPPEVDVPEEKVHVPEPPRKKEVVEELEISEDNTTEENSEESIETIAEEKSEKEETPAEEEKSDEPAFEAPINEEALAKQREELKHLSEELEKLKPAIESGDNFRAIRKSLVALKEQVIAQFLIDIKEKDPLLDSIQNAFETITGKQKEEREELNKIFDENLEKVEPEIKKQMQEAVTQEMFKDGRKQLIDIQKSVKDNKLRASDRDKLFALIQDGFDVINAKEQKAREEYEMECSENYLTIKPKVQAVVDESSNAENFNDSRKKLIELQKELKDLKLTKANRNELFTMIREVFNKINDKQDEERKEFNVEADKNYEVLKPVVDEAIKFAIDPTNFAKARQKLIDTQKNLKDVKLTRDQRDELFGMIRKIFNKLNDNTGENTEDFKKEANINFLKLEIKVNEAIANVEYSDDFRDIREGLVTVQDEVKILKITRKQRNELLSRIRKAFDKFDSKRKAYTKRRKSEKKRKLQSILDNLELKNKKNQEQIDADKVDLKSNEDKLESASDEEKESISKIIASINDKIKSKEDVVKANNTRIENIKNELTK